MTILKIILFFIVLVSSVLFIRVIEIVKIFSITDKPDIKYQWWGRGNESQEDKRVYPFKINVSDDVLHDLKYRLEHTRALSEPLENTQWYGFNGNLARDILDYWKKEYNWSQRETYLNKFPQFITSIQGLKIHFIHVKPQNVQGNLKVLPLLILHGWPGSLREFYEIIPILTTPRKDRNFVFEVIAPHLPGFVFSEASSKPGLGALEASLIFKNLMSRLGFEKFYVQGGDLGAIVLHVMSANFEEQVLGFHVNTCLSVRPISVIKLFLGALYPQWISNEYHQEFFYPLSKFLSEMIIESGYLHLQATKPDTLGISMDDSPLGLAAYNLEKFIVGANFDFRSREDGGLKKKFGYGNLLDNIMFYWITKCATTSFRFYSEIFNTREFSSIFWLPVNVPTACARFKYDIILPDEVLSDTYNNLVHINNYDGGHFAAFEAPEVLADDIFSAINKMELINSE